MWREIKVGEYCHWCGESVPYGHGPRTGKHLFCRNKNRCKMAHARAYSKYVKRVTPRSGCSANLPRPGPRSSNAQGGLPTRTSSPAIPLPRSRKSNAKRRQK